MLVGWRGRIPNCPELVIGRSNISSGGKSHTKKLIEVLFQRKKRDTNMPAKPAPGPGAPRPVQRHPGIASKPDAFALGQREGAYAVPSPQFQATPTSHVSPPSHAKSPGFGFQGGISPVGVDQQGTGRPQLLPQPRAFNNQTSPPAISMPQTDPNDSKSRLPRGQQQRVAATYYPSPFQKHYDQLGKFIVRGLFYIRPVKKKTKKQTNGIKGSE